MITVAKEKKGNGEMAKQIFCKTMCKGNPCRTCILTIDGWYKTPMNRLFRIRKRGR